MSELIDGCKRDDFEKFCTLNDIYYGRHHKYPEQYQHYETQLRWMGWQAALQFKSNSVETDINKRWEQGIPHHPKSEKLFKSIADIDLKYCGDSLCWKSGGDGDNGEMLMYALDIHFEREDEAANVSEGQKP